MDNLTKLNTTPKGVQTRWGIGTVSSNIIDHCLQDSTSAAEEYAKASEYLVNIHKANTCKSNVPFVPIQT